MFIRSVLKELTCTSKASTGSNFTSITLQFNKNIMPEKYLFYKVVFLIQAWN